MTLLVMAQGPVVFGGKVEDRFKPTDKVKVILASATLMNKTDGRTGREQAWNHSAETRIKAGEDDKLLVCAFPNLFCWPISLVLPDSLHAGA